MYFSVGFLVAYSTCSLIFQDAIPKYYKIDKANISAVIFLLRYRCSNRIVRSFQEKVEA